MSHHSPYHPSQPITDEGVYVTFYINFEIDMIYKAYLVQLFPYNEGIKAAVLITMYLL